MADVTISLLPLGTPSGNLVLPISNGTNTYSAPLSDIQVNYNSLTNKPNIGIGGMQLFTSSGTFTVPASITKLEIHAIGGGGGAGNAYNGGGNGDAGDGGNSTVANTNITAGGGKGARTNSISSGAGGINSGTNVVINVAGNDGVVESPTATLPPGGTGLLLLGITSYGKGGNCTNGAGIAQGGGSGGYAIGITSVTPGTSLSVTVGAGGNPGSYASTVMGVAGSSGAVLIKW